MLLFIDLRDRYGITQVVTTVNSDVFKALESARLETVITVTGKVVKRSAETTNSNIPTGEIEVQVLELEIQSHADTLPLQVNSDEDYGEEIRLRYRYLDLRRAKMQRNIELRSKVI